MNTPPTDPNVGMMQMVSSTTSTSGRHRGHVRHSVTTRRTADCIDHGFLKSLPKGHVLQGFLSVIEVKVGDFHGQISLVSDEGVDAEDDEGHDDDGTEDRDQDEGHWHLRVNFVDVDMDDLSMDCQAVADHQ